MDLITNDYFRLVEENKLIFVTVYKKGFSLNQMDLLFREQPRIAITKFAQLKTSLKEATNEKVHIGEWKPLMSITISEDKMVAKMRLHMTETQLKNEQEKIATDT